MLQNWQIRVAVDSARRERTALGCPILLHCLLQVFWLLSDQRVERCNVVNSFEVRVNNSVVMEVLANSRKVLDDIDPVLVEQLFVANTGEFQYLGRLEDTSCDDDLLLARIVFDSPS